MTFQEFLATKRALAIVEHMETLSEDDARELFESLDDATVELIEQLLGEVTSKTVKRIHKRFGEFSPEVSAARNNYFTRRAQHKILRNQVERTHGAESGQPDTRIPELYDGNKLTSSLARDNTRKFGQATRASRFPDNPQ